MAAAAPEPLGKRDRRSILGLPGKWRPLGHSGIFVKRERKRPRVEGEESGPKGGGHLQVFRGYPETLNCPLSAPFGPGASRATVDCSPSLLGVLSLLTRLVRRWPDYSLLAVTKSIIRSPPSHLSSACRPSSCSSTPFPPRPPAVITATVCSGKADYSRRAKGLPGVSSLCRAINQFGGPSRPGLQRVESVAKEAKTKDDSPDVHGTLTDVLDSRHDIDDLCKVALNYSFEFSEGGSTPQSSSSSSSLAAGRPYSW